MSWTPPDHEVAAVRQLSSAKRYAYLVKHAADQGCLWSLRSESGWVLGSDGTGRELHPVWPHATYAAGAAVDLWSGSYPERIEIHEWLDEWVPSMLKAGRLVAVFPSAGDDDVAIEPDQFATDLQQELDKIE
jgi:uncharacterized protein DUF2750